jgi:chromosome segregation ATPase
MRESVQESIEELKSEIVDLQGEDLESKNKLTAIVKELETELESRELDSFDDFIEPLNESISNFETSHPRITEIINNIMSTLSGIGI